MLIFQNIHKSFTNGASKQTLFHQFDLSLDEGSFTVVAGSNGSGKSTLLGLLTGDQFPDEGHITLSGRAIENLESHRRMAFMRILRQDPSKGTVGSLSVLENLALCETHAPKRTARPLIPRGKTLSALKKDFGDHLCILDMGLENKLDTPVEKLSGGQRQALALMMIAYATPQLLLLDEHTAALDPKTSKLVMQFTNQLIRERNMSALMVTHDLNDALRYGDRLIFLREGRIVLDVFGQEKKALTLEHLIPYFSNHSM